MNGLADKTLRILLLEDRPTDAELVQFELQESGIDFTARVVTKEVDFLRALQEFSPDLILSDYDLPQYSGARALAEAQKRCPEVPFILVTGAISEERAIDTLTSGAKDYVMKNRLHRLAPAVRRALAEAEEVRSRKAAEAALRESHRTLEAQVEKRTAELQAVLDAAPIAIWIAHDPQCRLITGNTYANEIIMRIPSGGNVSRSALPGQAVVSYRVLCNGKELKPEEMPAQVAIATGKPVANVPLELAFDDGRRVHLLEGAVPLHDAAGRVSGAVATGSDITSMLQAQEALQRNNRRMELLADIASRLLASDEPQGLVEELCRKVMDFLDCQAFFNFLVDEERGQLRLNACAGIPAAEARKIEWLDYGVAVCGCAARDGCRIVAENIPETPDVRTELVKSYGIMAYACHPLLEQTRVVGTLSFGTRTRITFSPDDLSMMKAVADQVAIAMSRIRTLTALQHAHSGKKEPMSNGKALSAP